MTDNNRGADRAAPDDASLPLPPSSSTGGGLSEGFKRMLTGQNFLISDYTYEGAPGTTGTVALGTDFPSKILRLNVDEYGGKIV